MSTIADYSVFTKAFLASGMTDFSKLYGQMPVQGGEIEALRAFAVIPFKLDTPLTPREALNFDWSKLSLTSVNMARRVSCRDANGDFIGNIVRVQPNKRDGSIRFVAKVAVPGFVTSEDGSSPADAPYNTFVLVRTDASTNVDLPIAVATISEGYNLHRHKVVVTDVNDPYGTNFADPLDAVENANYVSFTINRLNGYTSVDFNPDAYATYDDVANALSRGIDGLHIAFDTASGDLKLLDKDGNVLDQANLPIKADVIIADGEEGYKYVKTDVAQDIHAAKAWMPEGSTAWGNVEAVPYTKQHAALVVGNASTPASRVFVDSKSDYRHPISTESVQFDHVVIADSIYMVTDRIENSCTLLKVKGGAKPTVISPANISGVNVTLDDQSYAITNEAVEVDVIKVDDGVTTCVLAGPIGSGGPTGSETFRACPINVEFNTSYTGIIETSGGSSVDRVLGITLDGTSLYTFDETPSTIQNMSGEYVRWLVTKALPGGSSLKYGLEAFVWTVKDREVKLDEPFFKQLNDSLLALGFHEGDDIALGTNLAILAPTDPKTSPLNRVDADEYVHGKDNKATREQEVNTQRANAKEELVAWNAQHPALTEDRNHGTIIDSSGLDVRAGHITLGCGRVGKDGEFQKINYGIQMRERYGVDDQNTYESLDFTVSHHTGLVKFDANGHAAQTGGNEGLVPLTSSTLLSIEAGSYISGAPTCLILAEVTRRPEGDSTNPEGGSPNPPVGSPVFTPVRMTAGFSVKPFYDETGLTLTIYDYRNNIKDLLNHDDPTKTAPSIIEVQAIYTHSNAETVPAQQMHTYIGSWDYGEQQPQPTCSFSCNKIEEWMTAVGLADTSPDAGVKLYVVIRVY